MSSHHTFPRSPRFPRLGLLTFVLLLSGLFAIATPTAIAEDGGVPDQVAEFELVDVSGTAHRLSDYGAQPKMIMFWATWCPYCKRLFPTIKDIHQQHADDGLQVIAISVRDDGDVAAYIDEYGLEMDVLVKGDDVADGLGVPGTPAVVLLDPQNNIVYATTNSDPQDPGLRNAVAAVLAHY